MPCPWTESAVERCWQSAKQNELSWRAGRRTDLNGDAANGDPLAGSWARQGAHEEVTDRPQYPVRHLPARTDSDQVRAVRFVPETRMTTQILLMFDHVKKCVRIPIMAKQMSRQSLLSSYLVLKKNLCEECKLIPEYDDQFKFYSESGAPYGFCVNLVQQNRPITSAKHTSSQDCKYSP